MSKKDSNESFLIKGSDGTDVFVYCWEEVSEPKGVVQIFHGMAEHAKRYENFAKHLNRQGYIVFADDHRGHGKTAESIEELGYIGEDGFNQIVEDEHAIMEEIRSKHPQLPIVIFGHSFGSFLAQEFIIRYGKDVAGVVLCGSAARTGIEVSLGKKVASIEKYLFGERNQSRLLDYLSFSRYNKRIKDSQSKFAWLSRNRDEVRKYEDDPYCGTLFTSGFFYYFFEGLSQLYVKERLAKIPKDLPIFIIAGDRDPVGNYGRLVKKLSKFYKVAKLQDVQCKLYQDGRHELLNETNKEEVYEDVVSWVNERVSVVSNGH
ncbi:alpha/beta hydrolase [Salipaludibacillus daqingensis]|uniref:alpha/beta hydrolase n=1 Tax=Salipaludibacillus daqingensis TaxID=3041001 RepID=UPI00247607B2|nr:alpha/beta hydrolase [Salipaludibacillus daqingensis]